MNVDLEEKSDNSNAQKHKVNQKLIAEISACQAETLDPDYTDERSRPPFNTLPEGTVDYCEINTENFYNLACGKRVYSADVKVYEGKLPAKNQVKFIDSYIINNQFVMEFGVGFKAPFNVSYGEQDYKAPNLYGDERPDYSVSSFVCKEISVEFEYCAEITGKIKLCDNGVFDDFNIDVSKDGNAVLNLKLKHENIFCGYTAEYNSKNNLCFYFTNITSVKKADNKYGYSLAGKKIMLDAGHGGEDCGAVGNMAAYTESNLNLILCNIIKIELESIGAEVIMTRSDDTRLQLSERTQMIYRLKPDVFISVHRNAAENTEAAGYENFYYYPFSKMLAESVFNEVSGAFERSISVKYYPFYVNRAATCPSTLTENGFVSNDEELDNIKIYKNNKIVAEKTVQGIVDYFVKIG